jgi:hypothetical protein
MYGKRFLKDFLLGISNFRTNILKEETFGLKNKELLKSGDGFFPTILSTQSSFPVP